MLGNTNLTNSIAVFDVDNTILKGQSQHLFLKFARKKGLIKFWPFLKILSWFFLYKIKLANNPKLIMEYAFSFLKGKSQDEMAALSEEFFEKIIMRRIFSQAISIIKKERVSGNKILILSSAADFIIQPIAKFLGASGFISTQLEKDNATFTGKIEGSLVYGKEKLPALKAYLEKAGYPFEKVAAYADHESDIKLLSGITYPHAVNPTMHLRRYAKSKNWPIIDLRT